MNKDIISYRFEQAMGHFQAPNINNPDLNDGTITEIINAWNKCAIFDQDGKVWVQKDMYDPSTYRGGNYATYQCFWI